MNKPKEKILQLINNVMEKMRNFVVYCLEQTTYIQEVVRSNATSPEAIQHICKCNHFLMLGFSNAIIRYYKHRLFAKVK